MRGKRKNIYITAEQDAQLTRLGVTAQAVFDVGLVSLTPLSEFKASMRERAAASDCPHPKARRDGKNPDLCRACGTMVIK